MVIRSLATQAVLMGQLVVGAVRKAASGSPRDEEQTETGDPAPLTSASPLEPGELSLPAVQQPPPEEKIQGKVEEGVARGRG
jgi:hypothetical protein